MAVISATIEEYYQGAWTATVEQTEPYAGSFDLGGFTWTGVAVSPVQEDGGRYRAQIVGGAGGLGKSVAERQYYGGSSVSGILSDILKACGEVGGTPLTTRAPSYQRQASTAGAALDYLCKTYGLVWYVGRDGRVTLMSSRVGLPAPDSFQVLTRDALGPILQANDGATLVPGDTFEGQTIRHIRWIQSPQRLVAEVSFKEPISKPEGLDYHKTYGAKVERQNSDGTLDVIVNGKFGLSKVKWLVGLPGWVEAKEGDLVSVGFWNADPRQPYAIGIELVTQTRQAIDMGQLCLQMGPPGPLAAAVAAVYYAEPPELTGGITVWNPIIPAVPPTIAGGPPTPVSIGVPLKGVVLKKAER
jgi:hypothetical protein